MGTFVPIALVLRYVVTGLAECFLSGSPRVVWLFGLSGAGKTTIAEALTAQLQEIGLGVTRLDGDDLRKGLCADLGYDADSRYENLRRAAHVARILSETGLTVICSFVTPLKRDRSLIREILGERLCEVFVDTELRECERRDPKGLYRKARNGEIPDFTGISAPFEIPDQVDLTLSTDDQSVAKLVHLTLGHLGHALPPASSVL